MSLGFKAKQGHVSAKNGVKLRLEHTLIDPYGVPKNGWGIRVNVNNSFINIEGDTPAKVYLGLERLLRLNNVEFTSEDCWLNLNLVWYDRVAPRHHMVHKRDLLAIAEPVDNADITVATNDHSVTYWGCFAWDFLGVYLAVDSYKTEDFRALLDILLSMLNPNLNPSIGHSEAYITLANELDRLDRDDRMILTKRSQARIWLVDFHNSVNVRLGKQKVSYDVAAKNYLWA